MLHVSFHKLAAEYRAILRKRSCNSSTTFHSMGRRPVPWYLFATTHYNTHCNTLQQWLMASLRHGTLQHTVQHTATHCNTYCNTLHHTATESHEISSPWHTTTHSATHCNALQHTLQHTAPHYNRVSWNLLSFSFPLLNACLSPSLSSSSRPHKPPLQHFCVYASACVCVCILFSLRPYIGSQLESRHRVRPYIESQSSHRVATTYNLPKS